VEQLHTLKETTIEQRRRWSLFERWQRLWWVYLGEEEEFICINDIIGGPI
jgi:hypothetical protein